MSAAAQWIVWIGVSVIASGNSFFFVCAKISCTSLHAIKFMVMVLAHIHIGDDAHVRKHTPTHAHNHTHITGRRVRAQIVRMSFTFMPHLHAIQMHTGRRDIRCAHTRFAKMGLWGAGVWGWLFYVKPFWL